MRNQIAYFFVRSIIIFNCLTCLPALAEVSLKNTNDKCENKCSQTLTVGQYKFRYSYDTSLIVQASYNNIEWALVEEHFERNDISYTKYYLHNSSSRRRSEYNKICYGLDRDISAQGELLCIRKKSVVLIGGFQGKANKNWPLDPIAKIAVVDHNDNGNVSFAYVSEQDDGISYNLHVNNLTGLIKTKAWLSQPTQLHSRSDFNDILAVDSTKDGHFVVGLYEWINAFNKGLVAYNFDGDQVTFGQVRASETFNFGFSPKVVMDSNRTTFSAYNSTIRQREQVILSNEELQNLFYQPSNFMSASQLDLMIGAGIQPANWSVDQEVEVADETQAETKYKMNSNLLTTYYMQGRWDRNQLAVTMLQNDAENTADDTLNNDVERAAFHEYIVQYDYSGLFSGASTLRLEYRKLNAGGTAEYVEDNETETANFESKRTTYRALVMGERGIYFGSYYSKYDSPSVVGYVNSRGYLDGVAFDPDFSLTKFGFVIGYDEGSYGNRYETNYNRWYWGGEMGIGLVRLHTYNDTLIEATGEDGEIHGKNVGEFRAELDMGYIWQRKIQSLRGAGISILGGYKVQYEAIDVDPTESTEQPEDGWTISYKRSDLIHGPYVKINMLF